MTGGVHTFIVIGVTVMQPTSKSVPPGEGFSLLLAVAVAALSGGCAIHPLPDNVTGYDTYDIVAKIRCEAQEAVQDKAIALFEQVPSTQALAERLKADRSQFKTLNRLRLDPIVAFFVKKYSEAAIAYEFTFDITEQNVATAQANFLGPISNGVFRAGVGGNADFSRQNVRHFQVSDTFGRLLTTTIYCRDRTGPNYLYPITGSINIAEPIKQFIDLNEFQNLTGLNDDKVPTLAENLTFQTIVGGSATPGVTIAKVVSGLTDSSVTLNAKRVDIHRVFLGFSLPVAANKPAPFVTTAPIGPMLGAAMVVGNKTGAEINAFGAIQQAKLDQFLNRGAVAVVPVP